MTHIKFFTPTRLATAIKFLALMPLSLAATKARALEVFPGHELTIDASSPLDRYKLSGDAKLISNGATIVSVLANESTFEMNGGRVQAGNEVGVSLYDSYASIRDAHISSDRSIGLIVGSQGAQGSTADVFNTLIEGATQGVILNGASVLTLNNSEVIGGEQGLLAVDGNLNANQSRITGATNGIEVYRHPTAPNPASFTFNQTAVVGESGAAIVVKSPGVVEIDVNNGSTLQGGNGNMLELTNGGSANMRVNSSALAGNVQVGTGSALDLNLDSATMHGDVINSGGTASVGLNNGSILTGRLENVDKLAINSDATWVMVDHQQVGDLSLSGGNVKFGESGTFYQLDVANLSGNGTFHMTADFSTLTGDFLNVTGTSSGEHKLLIASSGADPLSADRLHVVHTADGGAQFSLLGDRVDVGTYSYSLINENEGKDWLLDPESKVISPSTNSVLALFNAAPSVLLGETTTLRTRMGELRFSQGQSAGLWTRAYGNRYEVSNDKTGLGYNQSQRGFSIGVDAPVEAGDGQWIIGGMVGHSNSNLDLNRGSSATINSYYVGGYATWLDAESGFYFDGVLKFNRLHNESNVAMSDGKKAKGNYTQNAVGASAEVGRHIKLADDYFVEPYGKLDAVITQAQSYTLDNGLDAKGDRSSTVIGELGTTVGRTIQLESGSVLQPYLKAAIAHEFDQSNQVSVNNNAFNNDLSGSRFKVGAGVAMSVSQNLKLHADLEHSTGKNIKQPYGVNVGLRYDF